MRMNEQPQHNDLPHPQQGQPEGSQPLYKADTPGSSTFSGYDLAATATPVSEGGAQLTAPQPATNVPHVDLNWDASEYIHHSKSPLWFLGLVVTMLALLAIAYFLTHSWTFIILVVVMAVAIGVFATRPPRTLHYALTDTAIQVDNTSYHYNDFRTFGIINDGALYSVMLIPTKRFMPAVSMYFAEEDGEKIVDILGARLPMEELHLDAIDRLMRRLRF